MVNMQELVEILKKSPLFNYWDDEDIFDNTDNQKQYIPIEENR